MSWRIVWKWARTVAIASAIPAAGAVLILVATIVASSGQPLVESAWVDAPTQHAAQESAGGTKWWEGAAGALLGALIGSCVPFLLAWNGRRIERRGELLAMQVEMFLAWQRMQALGERKISAPLYRLPLTMFEHALPKLIGEGELTANELAGLVEYVIRAEELNRGLQRAGEAAAANLRDLLDSELDRNLVKVDGILRDKQPHLEDWTVFDLAEGALYRLTGDIPPVKK